MQSATRGPHQRRRIVSFLVCFALGIASLGVLAWFGTHGERIEEGAVVCMRSALTELG